MDRDVKALKIYCPNKKDGCGWIGEIARVDDHLKECEISCSKCKQIVCFSTMKSHLDTECPCYCPHCDITAEREVISSEHKKCCKGPITCPNNFGVDSGPQDKFDKPNESQNEILCKIINSSILVELQKDISTIRKEVAQSVQIAKECSEKVDKQNDATLLDRLCNIRSYLTIAVLIIAILIALLLQSPHSMSENHMQMVEYLNSLQIKGDITQQNITEQIILLQEILNKAVSHQQYHYQLSDSVWSTKLWLASEMFNQVAPVIVKMSSFIKKVRNKEQWYSSPFFAFEEGYQMCLRIVAAGYGDGEGTHVSVYLHLMKGPHDDKLEQSGHWPLRGTFTIELLNQLNDSDHHSRMVQFHHYLCRNCSKRVLEGVKASSGLGNSHFISHDTLFYHSNNSYHKSDFLIFRISYEGVEVAPCQVAPVSFKVTKFSQWLKNNVEWYSNPFFAFEGGYQMCLRVDAAGNGEGEGTNVSVFLHLMKGLHDDKLEQSGHWPLRGTFTIELLNQLNNGDHYSRMVQFHHNLCIGYADRVLKGAIADNGCNQQPFIFPDTIFHHNYSGYLKDDCVSFRISYEDMEPPYQVTPVTFKVTKFSQWLKSERNWYSTPFIAFEEGYQMRLNVYAAGNEDGKGTHVSVYLHLMKGPHDDKLEQSGHWPLRGTFTIEILNQLNDGDHHSRTMQLHHHLCSKCTNRVLIGIEAEGWGISQFISHDTLLYHNINGYHKSDSLIFRISYEDIQPPYQVAPVAYTVNHFSKWLKSKEKWCSSAFFVSEEGYQMSLNVYAAGNGEGQGTHVSVYLFLMKGPHDDKLEQSGHWPLRGTFTIELLNQLSDNDHYHSSIVFNPNEGVNRVNGDDSIMIKAIPHFISHDILFQHNGYLKNGLLNIRISYLANKGNEDTSA